MLPIISTPSALSTSKPTLRTISAIGAVPSEQEPLTGEWQRAQGERAQRQSRTIFDGELVRDMAAVGNYLSAAGEAPSIPLGQIVSVYA